MHRQTGKLADKASPHSRTLPIRRYHTAQRGHPGPINAAKNGQAETQKTNRITYHLTISHTILTETNTLAQSVLSRSGTATES